MIKLRPYQEKARYWVNRQLNQGNNPLLVMPTGTGKSPTSAKIAHDRISLKKRLLVLVPQFELFNQMIVDYSFLNPGYIDDSGVNGRNRNIYICMVKSLNNILTALPEKFVTSFNEIIIDEAHFSNAETWSDIFNHFDHCLRFGMTATPKRYDNKPLSKFYNTMFEPITLSESIEKGYLCKPVIIVPDEYKNHIPYVGQEVNKSDQREFIKERKIIGDMVQVYRDVFNGLPVIIPCSTHEHAQQVTELYKNDGWYVDHIHSKMNKVERKAIIRRVKTNKTNVLTTVGVGVFGLNIIGLAGIIWLRLTDSITIYMQFNGRPMRPAEGKKYFIFIDPVGNSVIHGRPDIDRKWSLDTDYVPGQDVSESPSSSICPVCSVANSSDNTSCWICGYDFSTGLLDGEIVEKKKRKLPKMIDGTLVYLDSENYQDISVNGKNITVHKNDTAKIVEDKITELTRIQKVEILSRDLVGLKIKSKFREGLKNL